MVRPFQPWGSPEPYVFADGEILQPSRPRERPTTPPPQHEQPRRSARSGGHRWSYNDPDDDDIPQALSFESFYGTAAPRRSSTASAIPRRAAVRPIRPAVNGSPYTLGQLGSTPHRAISLISEDEDDVEDSSRARQRKANPGRLRGERRSQSWLSESGLGVDEGDEGLSDRSREGSVDGRGVGDSGDEGGSGESEGSSGAGGGAQGGDDLIVYTEIASNDDGDRTHRDVQIIYQRFVILAILRYLEDAVDDVRGHAEDFLKVKYFARPWRRQKETLVKIFEHNISRRAVRGIRKALKRHPYLSSAVNWYKAKCDACGKPRDQCLMFEEQTISGEMYDRDTFFGKGEHTDEPDTFVMGSDCAKAFRMGHSIHHFFFKEFDEFNNRFAFAVDSSDPFDDDDLHMLLVQRPINLDDVIAALRGKRIGPDIKEKLGISLRTMKVPPNDEVE